MSVDHHELYDIVRALLDRFRWKHHGYERLTCTSCGAEATEHEGTIRRREPCSPTCPWRRAEEWVA